MSWVGWVILGAGVAHVVEEYFWPGGFLGEMRCMAPRLARSASVPFAVVINGLMLVFYLAAAAVATRLPALALGAAALAIVNGLAHTAAGLRARRYVPGLLTGLVLYLPVGGSAYWLYARSAMLSPAVVVGSVVLALAAQAVPVAYMAVRALGDRPDQPPSCVVVPAPRVYPGLTLRRRIVIGVMRLLLRLGIGPPQVRLLTVQGRRSGRMHTVPVRPVTVAGERWVVAPYGVVGWVRNVRAHPCAVLSRGRRKEAVELRPAGREGSVAALRAYVARARISRPYLGVDPGAPDSAFVEEAVMHPVFLVVHREMHGVER